MEGRWQTAYDILVRPQGGSSRIEQEHNLIEANHSSTVVGTIDLSQLSTIRQIPGVDVAAPIAIIGQTVVRSEVRIYRLLSGFYRVREFYEGAIVLGEGAEQTSYGWSLPPGYHLKVDWKRRGIGGFNWPFGDPVCLPVVERVLAAAIDPEAEARLVGIDAAIIQGRYLDSEDRLRRVTGNGRRTELPLLVSSHSCMDVRREATFERLPLAIDEHSAALFERAGPDWLDSLHGEVVGSFVYDNEQVRTNLYTQLNSNVGNQHPFLCSLLLVQPEPRSYEPGAAPDGRAPELVVKPLYVTPDGSCYYRHRQSTASQGDDASVPILPVAVGIFDPRRLTLGRDPLTELPMETYRPVKARLVRDAAGKPLSTPPKVYSVDPVHGLLTQPVALLTTIDAARELYGDACISAIRVRIEGSDLSGEAAQRRIEQVAKEIHARTGLQVDVTYGSSPTRTLIYVEGLTRDEAAAANEAFAARYGFEPPPPPEEDVPPLGCIEEPWVKKNVHISIVRELDRGNLVVLGAVLLVAVLFVLCTTIVSVLARRRELGVLAGLGWRGGSVLGLVVSEPLLAGGVTALAGMGLAVLAASYRGMQLPLHGILATGGLAFVVYGLGAAVPGLWARRTPPFQAMRRGEVAGTPRCAPARGRVRTRPRGRSSLIGLALASVQRRWARNLLSVVGVAVATALLAAFCVVTWRMQGVLYGTLLGDYLAWQVGPQHFALAGLSLAIAALTMADLLSLNVAERRGELAVLQAVGWRPTALRRLVLAEGAALGLIGGLAGCCLSAWALAAFYRAPLDGTILVCLLVLPVTALVGLVGAWLPASLALRQSPAHGVRWE